MKRTILSLLSAMLALPGAGFAAQSDDDMAERLRAAEQRMAEAARELADLNLQMHGDDIRHVFKLVHGADPDRAMLGINIGRIERHEAGGAVESAGDESDGVAVLGVTPGGPAAGAGLRAGDVVLALNGQSLAGHGEPPYRRLQELMSAVEPGETVSLRFRRGDAEQTADVVTEAFEAHAPGFGDFDIEVFAPGGLERLAERLPVLPALVQHRTWRGLELVDLNADLGRYFGTDRGLLVVRAPLEESLALQAGDVVQTIGGATPRSVPDAMRLLRFYQPGDKLVVEVMRDKRGKTLELVVPDPGA